MRAPLNASAFNPAANEPVMTKQLSVQRYATALLVRLRRVARNDFADDDDDLAEDDDA